MTTREAYDHFYLAGAGDVLTSDEYSIVKRNGYAELHTDGQWIMNLEGIDIPKWFVTIGGYWKASLYTPWKIPPDSGPAIEDFINKIIGILRSIDGESQSPHSGQ